jgi:iron(II)-dependent oxidoreductase
MLKLFSRTKKAAKLSRDGGYRGTGLPPTFETMQHAPLATLDSNPLKRAFQQGRYCAILHDKGEWKSQPEYHSILQDVHSELEQRMALVPAGTVSISKTLSAQPGDPEEDISVSSFLLDVVCVTNKRYQHFVDAGGYDMLEYWPEEIWPHLIELKDLTGQPGPRYWRQSRHDVRLSEHPVVGISWYEAQAYTLWIGQRLPTEAEWQMAASWHLHSSTNLMRRFPWGDAMDKKRCNIWGSRIGGTLPVIRAANGSAPNHVLQLVGNVWEWSDTEYVVTDSITAPSLVKCPCTSSAAEHSIRISSSRPPANFVPGSSPCPGHPTQDSAAR